MKQKTTLRIVIALFLVPLSVCTVPFAYAPAPLVRIELLDINHAVSFWGIPMDSAWGTPGWHVRAAISHLFDKQVFVNNYAPNAVVIDNAVPKIGPLANWYLEWTPGMLLAVDPWHAGAISLYNNVDGQPDIFQARDHLVSSGGVGDDLLPWHDNDNNGIIDNPPTSQVTLYFQMDNPFQRAKALEIEHWIEYVFNGADVVNVIPVERAKIWEIILPPMGLELPGDWHIFPSGWSVKKTPPPDFIYDFYHSQGTWNYIFYNNALYDSFVADLNRENALAAQFIFGATIGTIPICSMDH